jgi:5-methylcytosine-specific restriction endonuclease McrA
MAKPGYDAEHKRERRIAIATMPAGTRCPYCHRPMRQTDQLDYDHSVPIALGGINSPKRLAHSFCNRSAGGRLGGAIRRARSRSKIYRPHRKLPRW